MNRACTSCGTEHVPRTGHYECGGDGQTVILIDWWQVAGVSVALACVALAVWILVWLSGFVSHRHWQ